ncbi:MAG: sigma-70 family RNA polymerase sigma factor [Anaerolineaceae bacterium]|nr:sigma-70 family RNA polymerase sigma factor [Anaerolineaceae bacterium]
MARSDWDLIQACRQGDEKAWKQVVEDYKRLVYSIALNYGLGQEDAAEVVQLTFMMLLKGLDTLHQDSHLGGWIATVARRNTWQLINRHRRQNLVDTPIHDNVFLPDENSKKEAERLEVLNWLHDGLSQLDATCRQLLLALFFDASEPSYSDVADRLGLALGSIGPMRARCLHRLRNILQET